MDVFLSYSSKDSEYASQLDELFLRYGVNVIRDTRNLRPLENIETFMQNISNNEFAIMLISENYLKSKYCIFEFSQFMTVKGFQKRIIPIMLPDFQFHNSLYKSIFDYIELLDLKLNKPSLLGKLLNIFMTKRKNNQNLVLFDRVWKYLNEIKLLDYNISLAKKFSDIFSVLGIFETEIWKRLEQIKRISNSEDQEISYSKLLQKHPRSHVILYNRGVIHDENGNFKLSAFHYKTFLKEFKEKTDQIIGYYGLGLCYTHSTEYWKAIAMHENAINLEPTRAWRSYAGLGDVYVKLKKYEKAYENYKKANAIVKDFKVSIALASIDYNRGHFINAAKFYQEGIDLNPTDPETYFFLKESYLKNGQSNEAERVIIDAYNKFPKYFKILTDYASLLFKRKNTDPKFLERILTKSYNLNQNYPPTRILLGLTQLLLYSNNKAKIKLTIKLLEDTLKVDMRNEETCLCVENLSLAYLLIKDNESLSKLEEDYSNCFSKGDTNNARGGTFPNHSSTINDINIRINERGKLND